MVITYTLDIVFIQNMKISLLALQIIGFRNLKEDDIGADI